MIHIKWPTAQDSFISRLRSAERESLAVIIENACITNRPSNRQILKWFCDLWGTSYESDSTCFIHDCGAKTFDPAASGNDAWLADTPNDPAGLLQSGPSVTIQTSPRLMHAIFHLRVGSVVGPTRVCSLAVVVKHGGMTIIKAQRTLRSCDFAKANLYQPCTLTFYRDEPEMTPARWDFRVFWFGRTDLWVDYVEVKDDYIDSLLSGRYDQEIKRITDQYRSYKSLFRIYLRDEPDYGLFAANEYIHGFLRREQLPPGIQGVYERDHAYLHTYMNVVKPNELLLNCYPLHGQKWGRTTEDSGYSLTVQLDYLYRVLVSARGAAKSLGRPLWFSPQAFGWYNEASTINPDHGGTEGPYRMPTSRELRCMIWLALACGAKGIMYFQFPTATEYWVDEDSTYWVRGLTRYNGSLSSPIGVSVRTVNSEIIRLSSILQSISCDTVFMGNSIPSDSYIRAAIPDWLYFGLFSDARGRRYFIVVNTNCHLGHATRATVVTESRDLIALRDHSSSQTIEATKQRQYNRVFRQHFMLTFEPGQGRLFQVVTSK